MNELKDILIGKSLEEIKLDLDSDKEFKNKDFLNMVLKIYPEKCERTLEVLPLCKIDISIFELIEALLDNQKIECPTIEAASAVIYCFELCGIDKSQILFFPLKNKKCSFTIKKITHLM